MGSTKLEKIEALTIKFNAYIEGAEGQTIKYKDSTVWDLFA